MASFLGLLSELVRNILNLVSYLVEVMIGTIKWALKLFGLKTKLSMELTLTYILAIIVLVVIVYFVLKFLKKWFYNSIVGLILLLLIRYIFGMKIPITLFTLLITALFGIAGVLTLLILYI